MDQTVVLKPSLDTYHLCDILESYSNFICLHLIILVLTSCGWGLNEHTARQLSIMAIWVSAIIIITAEFCSLWGCHDRGYVLKDGFSKSLDWPGSLRYIDLFCFSFHCTHFNPFLNWIIHTKEARIIAILFIASLKCSSSIAHSD